MQRYNNQLLNEQSSIARPLVCALFRPFRSRWNPIAPSKAKINPSTIDRPAINIYCRIGSKRSSIEQISLLKCFI